VENSLYSDPRVSEAAAVGIPDERLGEQVAAVVSVKPEYQGLVTEAGLIALSRHRCGSFNLSHRLGLMRDLPQSSEVCCPRDDRCSARAVGCVDPSTKPLRTSFDTLFRT
jgi:acyl-CoA synthetase (AMP-forming)/AMP-acid ligase II